MWYLLPAALALLLVYGWLRVVRFKRAVENVPTSKVKGVFMGMNEVKGTTACDAPLRTFLAERDAVWFDYSVEEHWEREETYTDSEGKTATRTESGWKTVDSGRRSTPFDLVDDTGRILVDPDGAKIEPVSVFSETAGRFDELYYGKGPDDAVSNSTGRRRFAEQAILVGDELYVLGTARLRDDVVAPMIAHDARDPYFVISTRSEKQITRGAGWMSAFLLLLGAFAALATPVVAICQNRRIPVGDAIRQEPLALVGAGLAFLAVWGIAYLALLYNGLVRTRNRLRRALSLIEVELKRRHDLIPNLAAAVKGLADHEQEAQEAVAQLRTLGAQELGTRSVLALEEAYPDLTANDAFMKLAEQIRDTEDRIALARSFYNDSLQVLRDRLQTVPDVLVAKLFAFKPGDELPPLVDREPPRVSIR